MDTKHWLYGFYAHSSGFETWCLDLISQKSLWVPNRNFVQFTCANFLPLWIIGIIITAKRNFTKLQWWTHKYFEKWVFVRIITLVVTPRDVNIHPGCWSGYYRSNGWQSASRRVVHGVHLSSTTADTDSALYDQSMKIRDRWQSHLSLTNYKEKRVSIRWRDCLWRYWEPCLSINVGFPRQHIKWTIHQKIQKIILLSDLISVDDKATECNSILLLWPHVPYCIRITKYFKCLWKQKTVNLSFLIKYQAH